MTEETTLQFIKDNWDRLIVASRKYYRSTSLPNLLACVKPDRLEGLNLVLSLNNPTLRSEFEDRRSRELLQGILFEVLGYPFNIEIEVVSE